MIITKKVSGEVDLNDGEFVEVQTKEVTTVKFWYDSEWLSKPVPTDVVLAEYSFKIPLQLRWAADQRLISVDILPGAIC